jgi:hypothetical protein
MQRQLNDPAKAQSAKNPQHPRRTVALIEDGYTPALFRRNLLQAGKIEVVWMLVRDPNVIHLAEVDFSGRTEKCPAVVEGLADEPWITHERGSARGDAETGVADESDSHMRLEGATLGFGRRQDENVSLKFCMLRIIRLDHVAGVGISHTKRDDLTVVVDTHRGHQNGAGIGWDERVQV